GQSRAEPFRAGGAHAAEQVGDQPPPAPVGGAGRRTAGARPPLGPGRQGLVGAGRARPSTGGRGMPRPYNRGMAVKVGINGFGRIGRNVYRAAYDMKADIDFVGVNDIGDAATFAHLLKHDTALGTFPGKVETKDSSIVVDGKPLKFLSVKDPGELPWRDLGVDLVVESTGLFTDAKKARAHIDGGGAKKVIIS